jgi:beta-lactamase regulating signal transducer with metallopeptidase domain
MLSLVFSMVIPLITIPVKSTFLVNNSFEKITLITGQIIEGQATYLNSASVFTLQNILAVFSIIVSFVLLIRFALNIFNLIRRIAKNQKVIYQSISLVLIDEKSIPHSFFRYVFVNRSDFEKGKIEKEFLVHEEAHSSQYHSLDIIFIELLNVFLWFNPATWLFKKAILLNHEYYADNKVLANSDIMDYQQLLLNSILRNNANYLVSNFKYSSIKSRLKMMTKSNPLHNAVLRKISAISLFLIVAITLTFSQEIKNKDFEMNYKKAWWYPILKMHNMKPRAFNTFDPVFEMGSTNSIDGKIVTLKDAVFVIKLDTDDYIIIKSPLAYHDLDKNTIKAEVGTFETYRYKSKGTKPFETITFKSLNYQIIGGTFQADSALFTLNNINKSNK